MILGPIPQSEDLVAPHRQVRCSPMIAVQEQASVVGENGVDPTNHGVHELDVLPKVRPSIAIGHALGDGAVGARDPNVEVALRCKGRVDVYESRAATLFAQQRQRAQCVALHDAHGAAGEVSGGVPLDPARGHRAARRIDDARAFSSSVRRS